MLPFAFCWFLQAVSLRWDKLTKSSGSLAVRRLTDRIRSALSFSTKREIFMEQPSTAAALTGGRSSSFRRARTEPGKKPCYTVFAMLAAHAPTVTRPMLGLFSMRQETFTAQLSLAVQHPCVRQRMDAAPYSSCLLRQARARGQRPSFMTFAPWVAARARTVRAPRAG